MGSRGCGAIRAMELSTTCRASSTHTRRSKRNRRKRRGPALGPSPRLFQSSSSAFETANQTKVPRGEAPTNTSGLLHGCGRSTVALMVELPPGTVAGTPAVILLTTPPGVRHLTTASKVPMGFNPVGASTRPVTVTETCPLRSTSPLPDAIAQATPPPRMFRSLSLPTNASPLIPVIESNSISVPPSCAAALTVPEPTRLRAPIAATRNLRQQAMALDLPEPDSCYWRGYPVGLPGSSTGRRPKSELSSV